jgi:hypothetical protein
MRARDHPFSFFYGLQLHTPLVVDALRIDVCLGHDVHNAATTMRRDKIIMKVKDANFRYCLSRENESLESLGR